LAKSWYSYSGRCQKVSGKIINPRKLINKSKTKEKNKKIAQNVRKHENSG